MNSALEGGGLGAGVALALSPNRLTIFLQKFMSLQEALTF